MDLLDLAIKGGLGITATIFLGLFLLEQRRHDKTRHKYSEIEKERQTAERELERERMAIQRQRIEADNDNTRMLTILSERIAMLQLVRSK